MATTADDDADMRVLPRALAGATVLQIVPTLHDNAVARTAVDIARSLVHAGSRSIIAAERGGLVDELKSFGGEWLPFASTTLHPWRLRANAERLATFLIEERVDIVHAKSISAAWIALRAIAGGATRLVTELPDLRRSRMWLATLYLGAVSRGDWIIARSLFNAGPMIRRYGIPPEHISVIPRSIDTKLFDPMIVDPKRVAALRQSWGIPSGARIVMTPGRVAPWNGQIHLVGAARALSDEGHSLTFVLVGDDRRHPRYVRRIMQKAREAGVDALFRVAGHVADIPAAYAAADVVVVPYVAPPVYGRVVAEAQAMARPVVAASVGPLPECLLAPPRMPEELRTGWLVPRGDPAELARAIAEVLSLDAPAYRALAGRARQYGEFMFTPQRVATATLAVYSSVLEAEASGHEFPDESDLSQQSA